VRTATRLFYAHGINSVGIDQIIEAAGVAKMTLYGHFKSKDELLAACVEARDAEMRSGVEAAMGPESRSPGDRIGAVIEALAQVVTASDFRGVSVPERVRGDCGSGAPGPESGLGAQGVESSAAARPVPGGERSPTGDAGEPVVFAGERAVIDGQRVCGGSRGAGAGGGGGTAGGAGRCTPRRAGVDPPGMEP
jgi:hypothetical protein